MANIATVPPVFLKQKNIPDATDKKPTALEICLAAERSSGQGSIVGAQEIRGLWRIYPVTKEARSTLLIKGIVLRECTIQASNTNPFILRDGSGEEKPSTKVWVDDLPLSVANTEIEHSLIKTGCELRSQIKTERARDADGKLTRFLTGRRFVFITVPSSPLDRFLKISLFVAKVYHKEQKTATRNNGCSRCLDPSHHVSECTGEIVCRQCRQPGHKRGDPLCKYVVEGEQQSQPTTTPSTAEERPRAASTGPQPPPQATARSERAVRPVRRHGNKTMERPARAERDDEQTGTRGRPLRRQTTLLELEQPRSRSGTPKRRRSGEPSVPLGESGKHARRDDDDDDGQSWSDCAADPDLDDEDPMADH